MVSLQKLLSLDMKVQTISKKKEFLKWRKSSPNREKEELFFSLNWMKADGFLLGYFQLNKQ